MFETGNTHGNQLNYEVRTENRYTLHPQGLRRCLKCNEVKPMSDFPIKGVGGRLNSSCKTCENTRLGLIRDRYRNNPLEYCHSIIPQLRFRAKEQEVPFELEASDLFTLWELQNGLCYYTGQPMNLLARTELGKHPHLDFPSIDRMNPKDGYVKENLCWCTYGVNRAKNDLDHNSFLKMCQTVTSRLKPIPA